MCAYTKIFTYSYKVLVSVCIPWGILLPLLMWSVTGSLIVYGQLGLCGHLEWWCLPWQAEQVCPYLQAGAYVHLSPSWSLYKRQIETVFFSPLCHPDDVWGWVEGRGLEVRVHSVVVCSSLRQMLHRWRTLALPTKVSFYRVRSTSPQLGSSYWLPFFGSKHRKLPIPLQQMNSVPWLLFFDMP